MVLLLPLPELNPRSSLKSKVNHLFIHNYDASALFLVGQRRANLQIDFGAFDNQVAQVESNLLIP